MCDVYQSSQKITSKRNNPKTMICGACSSIILVASWCTFNLGRKAYNKIAEFSLSPPATEILGNFCAASFIHSCCWSAPLFPNLHIQGACATRKTVIFLKQICFLENVYCFGTWKQKWKNKYRVRRKQIFLIKISQAPACHSDLFILKKHQVNKIQAGRRKVGNSTQTEMQSLNRVLVK